jgi:hypothetical protein
MMHNVNWWLMVLAFVLGLILTLALTVRRVKREVPEYAGGRGAPAFGSGKAERAPGAATTATAPGAATAAAGAGAGAAGVVAASKFTGGRGDTDVGTEPYGAGSLRTAGTADAPSGYDVKGNEDSMLYHTTASPSYERTIAEIWFRDEETAIAAGFNRWDSGKSQRKKR